MQYYSDTINIINSSITPLPLKFFLLQCSNKYLSCCLKFKSTARCFYPMEYEQRNSRVKSFLIIKSMQEEETLVIVSPFQLSQREKKFLFWFGSCDVIVASLGTHYRRRHTQLPTSMIARACWQSVYGVITDQIPPCYCHRHVEHRRARNN